MNGAPTLPDAIRAADALDPLRHLRDQFVLPDGMIYLDGNSLGALPRATAARVAAAIIDEWGRGLITSWNAHDWIGAPQRIGAKIAGLIGAGPREVVVADSTSVNLFKLLAAACRHQRGRNKILSEPGNFPTDLYVAQGVERLLPECRLETVPVERLAAAIDEDTAVVLLTHVHYKTGRRLDMAAITAAAHARGALVLWDLSHSVGAIEIDLNGCDADLAVGCGYKYLNGGPGAPAFLFVAERLQGVLRSPLSGWMGHARPFDFVDGYEAAPGIDRFLCGTPPILAMAALESGVDLIAGVDRAAITAKAAALSDLFLREVEPLCAAHGFTLVTPRRFAERGSHVSLAHDHAYGICQALIARGVIGDFRAPDMVRFGFTPLYTSFADVWRAVAILGAVMASRAWDDPRYQVRERVT